MGFYQDQIIPLLTNMSMRQKNLALYRERVVPEATGRVLEVRIGSRLNLPLYSRNVQQVIGLDPSPKPNVIVRDKLRLGISSGKVLQNRGVLAPERSIIKA